MMALTRDQILGAAPRTTKVELPELSGEVYVRQMSARERLEFLARGSSEDRETVGAWLVAMLTVDDKGQPIFTAEDVQKLHDRPFGIVDRIAEAILRLNGLHRDSAGAASGN